MSTISIVPMTDSQGRSLLEPSEAEPEPGSVVLMNGEFGCAWQRQFDDGLWHCVRGGNGKTWARMLTKRNLVLVYDAPVRGDRR